MGKTSYSRPVFNKDREDFAGFHRDSGKRKVRGQRRKTTSDDLIEAEILEMEAAEKEQSAPAPEVKET